MFVDRLWDSLLQAAAPNWDVVREWADLDGAEGATVKAREADAIVIMGGEDVDPHHYGGSAIYPEAGTHWRRADEGQMALVHTAIAHQIPLLGICRGMQLIDVALGGTLVQHMDQPGHHSSSLMEDAHFARHLVNIESDSSLAKALGTLAFADVHSAHHQCLDRVAPELRVVARAADGVIEAVEHRSASVVGVQWHPEDPEADPAGLRALLGMLDALRPGVGVAGAGAFAAA